MTKSRLSYAGVMLFALGITAVLFCSTGCEWESSGSEGSWSDSMGWVNFSGLYRSGSSGQALVENFSLSSGGTVDSGDSSDGSSSDSDYNETAGGQNDAFTQDGIFTTVGGTIDYDQRGTAGVSLKPGSVTVRLDSLSTDAVGSFSDSGGGVLSGSFSQAPGGETFSGTGTIDYDSGVWALALEEAFLGPASVSYGFTILSPADVDVDAEADVSGEDDADDNPPTRHDWVYSLQVSQTGNRLSFIDNRGFLWEGSISHVTTPGGDNSGGSPGDVVATFEVKGNDSRYMITGTFSGSYTLVTPDEGVQYGVLTERRIQGIWIEPTGNGDLYGETVDGDQTAVQTTTTE